MTIERLAQALENASTLMGVCIEHEGEVGVIGKYVGDYQAVYYLEQLIKSDDADISINPDKIGYLKKVLH